MISISPLAAHSPYALSVGGRRRAAGRVKPVTHQATQAAPTCPAPTRPAPVGSIQMAGHRKFPLGSCARISKRPYSQLPYRERLVLSRPEVKGWARVQASPPLLLVQPCGGSRGRQARVEAAREGGAAQRAGRGAGRAKDTRLRGAAWVRGAAHRIGACVGAADGLQDEPAVLHPHIFGAGCVALLLVCGRGTRNRVRRAGQGRRGRTGRMRSMSRRTQRTQRAWPAAPTHCCRRPSSPPPHQRGRG